MTERQTEPKKRDRTTEKKQKKTTKTMPSIGQY